MNIEHQIQDLIYILSNISATPPQEGVDHECKPPPLISDLRCEKHSGLKGKLKNKMNGKGNQTSSSGPILNKKRKIILLILFGFEVDTLEIALHEQLEFVDKVFIVESSLTHKGVKILFLAVLQTFIRNVVIVAEETFDVGLDQTNR